MSPTRYETAAHRHWARAIAAEKLSDRSYQFRGRPQPDPLWDRRPFQWLAARHWGARDRLLSRACAVRNPLPCTCGGRP